MAFRPPTFNLTVDIYHNGSTFGTPDATFMANLSPGKRTMQAISTTLTPGIPNWWETTELLCPAGTDIRGYNANEKDMVEVPQGSNRCYLILWVEDVGKGFSNEYRLAVMVQCGLLIQASATFNPAACPLWPIPTP